MLSFPSKLLVIAVVSWSASLTVAVKPVHSSSIELHEAVRFLTPDGSEVVVGPGSYTLEPAERGLRIIPSAGERTNSVLVEARPIAHEESLTSPLVTIEQGSEDMVSLRLLLPERRGWEAQGAPAHIASRGSGGNQRAGGPGLIPFGGHPGLSELSLNTSCSRWGKLDGAPVPPTDFYWIASAGFTSAYNYEHLEIRRSQTAITATKRSHYPDEANPYQVYLLAPVHLPKGAEIRKLRTLMTDTDPQANLEIFLAASYLTNTGEKVENQIVGVSSNCLNGAGLIIVNKINHQVDNATYAYSLIAKWGEWSKVTKSPPKISVGPVRIGYTVK